jgi:two-component system LytT family sensor kinase
MEKKPSILQNQQQKKINYLQARFTPYFLILLFVCSTAVLRLYLIPDWAWWWHVCGFIGQFVTMTCIWHLILLLNRFLEKRVPFEQGPLKRMFLQVFLTMLVLAPIISTAIYFIRPYLPPFYNNQFIAVTLMLFVVIIFLFNFSFYASYFFRNWQDSIEDKAALEVQAAELEREKFNLQYHQLRNQVNPHYLFNTLTSLDGLIHTNPELASEFVRHMSKVYRYVLRHKENEVVNLEEELEFISHYIELLHIRYGNGLNIHHNISAAAKEKGIVMVTLQMLIDNAIKHNTLQETTPLKIIIWDENGYLVIYNNKQLRRLIETSNKKGLLQLEQLYSYLSDKPILVEDNHEHYTIKIPLL